MGFLVCQETRLTCATHSNIQVPPDLVIDEQDVLNPTVLGFVEFAGEDHRGWHTLEAFLDMLAALASGEDGARKVYELLQVRTLTGLIGPEPWLFDVQRLPLWESHPSVWGWWVDIAYLGVGFEPGFGAALPS